jgi:cytochrome P450
MIDEILRLESPVQFIWRVAVMDAEIGGVPIPAGTRLVLFLGSGNRDPRKFADADEFIVDRSRVVKEQLAFGRGVHLCVGAPLARLEGELAFDVIFDRLDNIRLATPVEEVRHIDNASFRAPSRLELEFSPARP